MPFYSNLRFMIRDKSERARVIANLQALSAQLDAEIPDKDSDQNLLLATWNVRDFGAPGTRRGFGKRSVESFFYIAEIISRFDFLAIQEVNELDEWETVMRILGHDWDYIATDVTDRRLGGNGERLLYCYDKRKVWFKNISGEIVLPPTMLISQALVETEEGKRLYAGKQFRRTPFITRFQSGWFKFDICTVHIYYGEETGEKLEERIEEIDRVARYFGERADRELKEERALILLGDFNIVHPTHNTMQALERHGYIVPKTLKDPTNFNGDKYYDQIAFKTKPEVIQYVERNSADPKKRNAGVLDIYKNIYTPDKWKEYKEQMLSTPNGADKSDTELKAYFKNWLTYQLSDHRPLWVRLDVNDSAEYLEAMRTEAVN